MRYLFLFLLSATMQLSYAQTETTNPGESKKETPVHHHEESEHHHNDHAKVRDDSTSSSRHHVSHTYKGVRERRVSRGYRVQIFSGAGGTKSKNTANQMAAKVRSKFPELSVYCRFKSPRWVCRVGDFATREAAQRYLDKIHKAKISNEATIVIDDVLLAK